MGITVTVESLFPPVTAEPWSVPYKTQAAQGFVDEICKAFNWQELPWQDPTERIGTIYSSFSYATWNLALRIASSSNFPEQNQKFPRSPFSTLNKDERFEWFRHFLDNDESINFYIPVDFDIPKHLYSEFREVTFVVASAFRLVKEIQDLQQEVNYYVNKYGPNTLVASTDSHSTTWDDIAEFCLTLQAACNEGIALGLPVQLLY